MILYNFIFIVAAGNMLTVGLKKHVFRLFIWSFRLLKSFLSNVLYTHIYQCSGINTWIPEEVSQSLKKNTFTVRNCSSKEQFLQGLICSIFGQSWLDFAMVTIIGKVACLNKIWGQQLMDNSKFSINPCVHTHMFRPTSVPSQLCMPSLWVMDRLIRDPRNFG